MTDGRKSILFIDFHGTLCHDLFWRSLPDDCHLAVQRFFLEDGPAILTPWMRGSLTSETVNRRLADRLGLPFEQLWQSFVDECETMFVSPQALKLIGRLRANAIAILVTDNMDCFTRFTAPALRLDRHFDAIVNSSDTGRLKADGNGAVFHDLAAERHIALSACTLLDDSADACANLTAMGGAAIRISAEIPIADALNNLMQGVNDGDLRSFI